MSYEVTSDQTRYFVDFKFDNHINMTNLRLNDLKIQVTNNRDVRVYLNNILELNLPLPDEVELPNITPSVLSYNFLDNSNEMMRITLNRV